MQDFYRWLLKESHLMNITIDLSEYDAQIRAQIEKINNYQAEKAASLQGFKFDPYLVRKGTLEYPHINGLISMLAHKSHPLSDRDNDLVDDEIQKYFTWYLQQKNRSPEHRSAMTHILDQHGLLRGQTHDPQEMEAFYNDLITKTQQNMETIKAAIQQAIEGATNWGGSPVKIMAQAGYSESFTNEVALQPGDDAQIGVGQATFTLFNHDGQFVIDDIIEGGEEDDEFFPEQSSKGDYYLLVNELRNPGSTRKGKTLTLFTARPQADRNFFMSTTWLPANLFLTNSASHADGLAHDLASNEPRDVWMVKIDSRYLTQTLDGQVKYYMVTQDKAPIVSMKLY